MERKLKISLSILGIGFVAFILIIVWSLYLMAIEDHYGDNQTFYFKAKDGDIIVNRDIEELRRIKKEWPRIYGIQGLDTTDLWGWLDENKVELYRWTSAKQQQVDLNYEQLDELIRGKKLDLIIRK